MGVVTGGGGGSFNGGTITSPLTINDAIGGNLLDAVGQHGEITLDGFGEIIANSDAGAILQLATTGAGNSSSVGLSDESGGTINLDTQTAVTLTLAGTMALLLEPSASLILFGGATAAPNSAFLSANQFALWLDPTNGASKLMIKAKSANGTVVTGSVTLA